MNRNDRLRIAAGAVGAETGRLRTDQLAAENGKRIHVQKPNNKATKRDTMKRDATKRKELLEDAKQIAFGADNGNLLGVGNRRISLSTGGLRKSSFLLYGTISPSAPSPGRKDGSVIPLLDPVGGGHEDTETGIGVSATESDDKDTEGLSLPLDPHNLRLNHQHRAMRRGSSLRTMSFRDQVKYDMRLLNVDESEDPANTHKDKSPPMKSSKLLVQEHASKSLGMTAANAKYTEKCRQGRFPTVRHDTKKKKVLPDLLRALMSPIMSRKIRSSSSSPVSPMEPPLMMLSASFSRDAEPGEQDFLQAHQENMLQFSRNGNHRERQRARTISR
jgi:hypothetical protein